MNYTASRDIINARMAGEKSRVWIYVHPGARRNEVQGEQDGVWHLKIAAPPVKGRANQELLAFLSDVLQTGKSNLIIEKGLTGRRKLLSISSLTPEQLSTRFNEMTGKQ
jgi:uncharacterized protein (TIGR00251 family)